jgi:hypothetical protein
MSRFYAFPDTYCISNRDREHRPSIVMVGDVVRCVCGARMRPVAGEVTPRRSKRIVPLVPEMPKAGTQQAAVLELLYRGPLCSYAFYSSPNRKLTHRLAGRIWNLKQKGWTISTRTCENPAHEHETRAVEYLLQTSA